MAAEAGVSAGGDLHGDPGGACDRAGVLVDREVVEGVAALDSRSQRRRFDHRGHLVVLEVLAQLPGAVRGVVEHLGACRLADQQPGGGLRVVGVAGGELARGDQPGVGLGGDVGFVAVPVGVLGLVHVPGLGVDRGDHPVRGGALGDPPLAGPVAGFDVLAGDQRQQGHCVGLRLGELELLGGPHKLVGVIDQLGHEPVDIGGVVPVTRRPARLQVVLAPPHLGEFGDELADPADLGGQHRDRVLAGHCVSSTVESSARRCLRAMTPVSAITARTAWKIRSGSSLARSLLRHDVNTVGWNASSVSARPVAAFQAMSVCNARQASRSERLSRAWSTITAATTSAGTDGRPRPDGNKSENISSGNSRWRCPAKNACTDPSPRRWLHSAAASSSSRSGRDDPCTPALPGSGVQVSAARSEDLRHALDAPAEPVTLPAPA